MDDVIYISPDDYEIVDTSEYNSDLTEHFHQMPEVAKPILKTAQGTFEKIKQMLYTAPSIINAIKSAVPDSVLQAVLTNDQKRKLATGALELMSKKDGSLIAKLVNPKTKKIVANIQLKSFQMSPEMTQAMTSFSNSMQMAEIAEQIQVVQLAIEEVRQGQEYDRLATAYSCQQKLLQAMEIRNPELRTAALLQLTASAEDSRNLLMLSQKTNVAFISDLPESTLGKFFSKASSEKIDSRMNEIRESLCVVNMVSLAEAMAYQEMGEYEAAKKSLIYYAGFLNETYLSVPGLVERLDLIDPAPVNYWSKSLPAIGKMINELPCVGKVDLLKSNNMEENKNEK